MPDSPEHTLDPADDVVPAESGTAPAASGPAPAAVPERVARGILLSLLIIPAGIVAWAIIWQLGFMSAIVAFGVAVGGAWLYRVGSGGRMGVVGIVSTVIVTVVTLVLAFLAGIGLGVATFLGMEVSEAIVSPEFWETFAVNVFDNPELWQGMTGDILFAILFAALGAFSVFWNLAKAAKAEKQGGRV